MKVECKIKRKGGTIVELPNGNGGFDKVPFQPLDATRDDSPHVADVTQAQAVMLFKADASVYQPFEAGDVPAPVAKPSVPPPPAPPAPPADPPVIDPAAVNNALPTTEQPGTQPPAGEAAPPAGDGQAATNTTADTNDDGRLSVRELKDAIAAGTVTPEALREMLEVEERASDPRKSFIDVITKALRT